MIECSVRTFAICETDGERKERGEERNYIPKDCCMADCTAHTWKVNHEILLGADLILAAFGS